MLIYYECSSWLQCYYLLFREATLAEMGVALGEDGHSVGLFQPKKVAFCSTLFIVRILSVHSVEIFVLVSVFGES